MHKAIKSMKVGKAERADYISAKLLKRGGNVMRSILHRITPRVADRQMVYRKIELCPH